jgi:energy-coupling factor transport system permease protein
LFTYAIYQPLETPLHRLNPAAKLALTLTVMVVMLMTTALATGGVILGVVAALLLAARAPLAQVFPFVRAALALSIIFAISWLVFTHAGTPIFGSWGPTDRAIVAAANAALRVVVMVLASALLLFITSESELLQGLRRLRVPYVACFTLMLSLRLLPSLSEDLAIIRQAQMCRGFELQRGSFIARAKRSITGLVPLVAIAFKRVETLSRALESRAFNLRGMHRTTYREDILRPVDRVVLGASLVLIVAFLVVRP